MGLYITFKTWEDVRSFAARGGRLWYHAPLDHYPVEVFVTRIYKNGKMRIRPPYDADSFTADAGHLDRFRWCPPHQYPTKPF